MSHNGSDIAAPAMAIAYHSGFGHTAVLAEAVAAGAREAGAHVRVIAVDKMTDEDWDVKVALTGSRALDLVRTTLPDLVILDVRLPDVSGWDILQALKLDARTASIPVLVCSAAVQELRELAPQLAHMGVDVLIKPFAIDTLLDKVRALTFPETEG